eukprot:TRINITY_DN61993_c0_g1_i1.p1 TRINITY_DN61993_c0_g1~~TRINITY_DN61993_c0_g1_i1.p1  ORF type:complete len:598 (-),score=105.29 TRINITY_DN61993_c0_g1_i1:32-1825(-)
MPKHKFGEDVIDPDGFSHMLNMISVEYDRLHAENLSLRFQLDEAGRHRPAEASRARLPKKLIAEGLHSAMPTSPISMSPQATHRGSIGTGGLARPRTVFHDPADMREELRDILAGPDEPRAKQRVNLYKTEGIMQAMVRHPMFETASAWAIVAYTLWLWVDTDLNTADIISKAESVFFYVDQIFCAVFFLEVAVRFMAYSSCRNCCRDWWFLFDLFLTSTMVADSWVMTIIVFVVGTGGDYMQEAKSVSFFRLFRLVRLVRLARMAKLIRKSAELLILLKAVTAAIRSAAATYILLISCHYVFAIGYCTSLKGYKIHLDYFGSVLLSMQSLYLHCTMMEDVTSLVSAFQEEALYPHLVFLYIFMFLSNTTILSMLMGVIVEVVSSVATAERESAQIVFVRDVLESFRTMGIDSNNDGSLDKQEFYCLLQNEQAMSVLESLGVDVAALVEIAEHIFGEEDDCSMDDQDLRVSFQDFLEMVLQLRGNVSATVKDVMGLRRLIKDNFRVLSSLSKNAGIPQEEKCEAMPVSDFSPFLRRTMGGIRQSQICQTLSSQTDTTEQAQSQLPMDEEDLKDELMEDDPENDEEMFADVDDCKLKL